MIEFVLARYNYWIVIALMMTGLYIVFARENLIKKVVGLNLFQTSVFILYITIGKVTDGTAPILPMHKKDDADHGAEAHGEAANGAAAAGDAAYDVLYSNPLPHVLILTAIVVGVATTAVGLALTVRIRDAYGTIEENDLQLADNRAEYGRDPDRARDPS